MNLVKLLYKQTLIDVNRANRNGDRCLHIALRNSNFDLVKWLLEQPQTNVNAADGAGDSILHLAVKKDHFEIIQKLAVECKADMGMEDAKGRLPVHCASFQVGFCYCKFYNSLTISCIMNNSFIRNNFLLVVAYSRQ